MSEDGNGLTMFETSSDDSFKKEMERIKAVINRPDEYRGLSRDINLRIIDALEFLYSQNKARSLYYRKRLEALEEKQKSMVELPKWLINGIRGVNWFISHPRFTLSVLALFFILINPHNRDWIVETVALLIKAFL